jgi:hypothetical protein
VCSELLAIGGSELDITEHLLTPQRCQSFPMCCLKILLHDHALHMRQKRQIKMFSTLITDSVMPVLVLSRLQCWAEAVCCMQVPVIGDPGETWASTWSFKLALLKLFN